jgi:hypothetical protein
MLQPAEGLPSTPMRIREDGVEHRTLNEMRLVGV